MGQIVPGVQLEDEDVVDADFPPPVGVDAQQEDHEDDEEHAPVHLDGRPVVHFALDKQTFVAKNKTLSDIVIQIDNLFLLAHFIQKSHFDFS